MEAKVLVVVKQLRVAKRLVSHVTRMYSTVLTMIFRASYCPCLLPTAVRQTRLA
jgi:hypothetical protein